MRSSDMSNGDLQRLDLAIRRSEAGITLEQIAESTKISRRFLQAIEEGDYKQLPGGVFTVNYIRQYAQEIGYDAAVILEHCQQATNPPETTSARNAARQAESSGTPRWARFLLMG